MWCAKAVGVAFLIILCSTFWKGSDACAVNISVTGAPRISVSEQQSYVQITLTSDNATSAVTVTAYPHAVTATNGSDVKLSNTSIKFSAGQTSVSTNITIVSDQSLENTETFYIQFVSTDPEVCILNNNITVRITNDDKVTVGFSDTLISVREDNAHIPIKLTLTGQSAIPVTVG
ncbi:uncharacterized protein LOC116292203 [Actinia tenebrosa]|uniref:Uncharacterized protein LOC116292203 n=1 Tax=Actinia tenebrosa TaxID=6105 RepID=A0A6P8HRP8_ACTTE|nr:uncharacterized protein LOC116292203 [Actinia tenebrosa]